MEIYQDNNQSSIINSLLNNFIEQVPSGIDNQQRIACNEALLNNENKIHEINFHHQYSHVYMKRLHCLRERILSNLSKEQQKIKICKVAIFCFLDKLKVLESPTKEQILIIGTFYKDSKENLKHKNQLNQFSKNSQFGEHCNNQADAFIEDETGRMKIHLDNIKWQKNDLEEFVISKNSLPNGIVVGLVGQYQKEKFFISSIILPGLSLPQKTIISKELIPESAHSLSFYKKPDKNDNFIALASGLNFNSKSDSCSQFNLLKKFILGTNFSSDFLNIIKRISKLMIVGNIIANSTNHQNFDTQESFQQFDENLSELASNISIDLIPGENDCSPLFWPQNSLPQFFFPQTSKYSNLHLLTNPFKVIYQDKLIQGTSGKNIKQLANLTNNGDNFLNYLEQTIYYQHVAPTAPDTLECYPFYEEDPFILNEQPNIYVVANSPQYESKLLTEGKKVTRLIAIPEFSETSSFVLVNLRNLDTFEIQLQQSLEN